MVRLHLQGLEETLGEAEVKRECHLAAFLVQQHCLVEAVLLRKVCCHLYLHYKPGRGS